ncbi:MAG: PTS sugar transporter subunit IIB [Deltaproteobacteria bacterium]|nr:PTS sugar transporter subunit IIB [Deltaproteobacteria bacterium]
MGIVLARVDNRYVHGQILEGWIPYTKATYIVIASDAVARNPIQRMAMETCATCGLNIQILEVEDAVKRLMAGEFDKWRVILLFGTTEEALRAVELGLRIEELNIGNIHFCAGKFQIAPSVSVDTEDLENLKALSEKGIRVVIRCVPSDPSRNIWEVVKRE